MKIIRPRLDDVTSLLATLNPPVTIYIQFHIDGSWNYSTKYIEGAERIEITSVSTKHLRKVVRRALDKLEVRIHAIKRERERDSSRTESNSDTGLDS